MESDHISGVIHRDKNTNQLPIGNKLNPSNTNQLPIGKSGLSKEQVMACDLALSEYSDLMCSDFKQWYCKAFYTLGAQTFTVLAAVARADGKNAARLFSHLIKKELLKQTAKNRLEDLRYGNVGSV